MRIEPGQHREKRAGGMIFEPMGREKAPGGAAQKDRPGKRSVCPAEDEKGGRYDFCTDGAGKGPRRGRPERQAGEAERLPGGG